jgi:hypothetical protein
MLLKPKIVKHLFPNSKEETSLPTKAKAKKAIYTDASSNPRWKAQKTAEEPMYLARM